MRDRCVDCGGPIAGTCCGHGWKRRAADATAEVIATRADRDQLARERDASTDAIARLVRDHNTRIAELEKDRDDYKAWWLKEQAEAERLRAALRDLGKPIGDDPDDPRPGAPLCWCDLPTMIPYRGHDALCRAARAALAKGEK